MFLLVLQRFGVCCLCLLCDVICRVFSDVSVCGVCRVVPVFVSSCSTVLILGYLCLDCGNARDVTPRTNNFQPDYIAKSSDVSRSRLELRRRRVLLPTYTLVKSRTHFNMVVSTVFPALVCLVCLSGPDCISLSAPCVCVCVLFLRVSVFLVRSLCVVVSRFVNHTTF